MCLGADDNNKNNNNKFAVANNTVVDNHHNSDDEGTVPRCHLKPHRHPSRRCVSPVEVVDPAVRALNTVMYGVLVHFGTLWIILGAASPYSASAPIPAATDDPFSCQTGQYGEVFATPRSSTADDNGTSWSAAFSPHTLKIILLLHGYWVYLQHANVLANPLCQRLDRQYGIALLKSNQHWAIAGTLSAYWCREALGMFLCLPFLVEEEKSASPSWTQYFILYSLIYHTIKSRGVRQDALRRYSPSFGIMRVVIDKFYWHTTPETLLTFVRLFLQGLDTWIHLCIIRGLLLGGDPNGTTTTDELSSPSTTTTITSTLAMLHALFVIWVIHAALNQYFRCSTASVMVQAWHSLTSLSNTRMSDSTSTTKGKNDDISRKYIKDTLEKEEGDDDDDDDDDDKTEVESASSDETEASSMDAGAVVADQDEFIVRRLLRPGRVPTELEGRQGAATNGVDTAVRIETALSILASTFLLGFGRTPFRILLSTLDHTCREDLASTTPTTPPASGGNDRLLATISLAWWLSSLLYGIWALFLKTSKSGRLDHSPPSSRRRALQRTIINMFDLLLLIGMATSVFSSSTSSSSNNNKDSANVMTCWYLAIGVTVKSYYYNTQAGIQRRPRFVSTSMKAAEFFGKLMLIRKLLLVLEDEETTSSSNRDETAAWIESILSLVWVVWVVSTPTPTPCEVASSCSQKSTATTNNSRSTSLVADVVFLGHPAELMDCWALWLLPYSLQERWQGPFWAIPLWPLHYIVGWYVCNYRQKLFGDQASFFCCDDICYEGIRMQTWTAAHFGRHFVTHPLQVKHNIEAAARHAERTRVKVLCLGALNKAESINSGGVGVVQALNRRNTAVSLSSSSHKLSVIHGNHLTAAAVVETTLQCLGGGETRGTQVFLTGASSKVGWAVARALRDRHGMEVLCHSTDPERRKFFQEQGFAAASKLSQGTEFSSFWIVGKYDGAVPHWIPHKATAVTFSVPHSLSSRPDVRLIEAGTLHMDLSRIDGSPRQFTNKLKEQEIFACHAASVVAAYRLKQDPGIERILEIGPVDPNTMDSWLEDAKTLGFQVPSVSPVWKVCCATNNNNQQCPLPVIIVGAGPAGLAVAASLTRQNIPNIILELQEDPTQFGSWEQHFSGLEVTTQKKWCQLPGFPMTSDDNEWNKGDEYASAQDYHRYLQLYAARFRLEIRRGVQVVSIEKGHNPQKPWTVQIKKSGSTSTAPGPLETLSALAVVVATGKHRVPRRGSLSCLLADQLQRANIPYLHTADLRDDASWSQAIQAARKGRLAMVGFGNSAADVITNILQQCPEAEADATANAISLSSSSSSSMPCIHIAARTVPPVFPRQASIFRVDTIGYWVRQLRPISRRLEDLVIRVLWCCIPSSRICNDAFPAHLPRWNKIAGRVPVIDKQYGKDDSGVGTTLLASAFQSGRLVGHGPVLHVIPSSPPSSETKNNCSATATTTATLTFDDSPHTKHYETGVPIEMVIFATGYMTPAEMEREMEAAAAAAAAPCKDHSSSPSPSSCWLRIPREDRCNGLYHCGLGNDDRLLPLYTIGEQAESIAKQINAIAFGATGTGAGGGL